MWLPDLDKIPAPLTSIFPFPYPEVENNPYPSRLRWVKILTFPFPLTNFQNDYVPVYVPVLSF